MDSQVEGKSYHPFQYFLHARAPGLLFLGLDWALGGVHLDPLMGADHQLSSHQIELIRTTQYVRGAQKVSFPHVPGDASTEVITSLVFPFFRLV
jgi:hypothetical protein